MYCSHSVISAKKADKHPAAFRRRLLIQLDGLFGLLPLELGEVFHLLLGELHMGHRLDAAVASDGQQALIGNGGVVDPDVGELGDGGCLGADRHHPARCG